MSDTNEINAWYNIGYQQGELNDGTSNVPAAYQSYYSAGYEAGEVYSNAVFDEPGGGIGV